MRSANPEARLMVKLGQHTLHADILVCVQPADWRKPSLLVTQKKRIATQNIIQTTLAQHVHVVLSTCSELSMIYSLKIKQGNTQTNTGTSASVHKQ